MFPLLFELLFLQETLLSEDSVINSVINGVISHWPGQSSGLRPSENRVGLGF